MKQYGEELRSMLEIKNRQQQLSYLNKQSEGNEMMNKYNEQA